MGEINTFSTEINNSITDDCKMLLEASSVSSSNPTDNRAVAKEYTAIYRAKMKSDSKNCQEESQKVAEQFSNLLKLIEEVLEASFNTSAAGEKEMESTKKHKEKLEKRKKAAEEKKKEQEQEEEKRQKRFNETEDYLKETLGGVPRGLELLGFEALDRVINMIQTIVNKMLTDLKTKVTGSSTSSESDEHQFTTRALVEIKLGIAREINIEVLRKLDQVKKEEEKNRGRWFG